MFEAIGILLTFAIVMAGSIIFDAWAVSKLYGWFIQTAFATAPALSIAQVAGVLLVFRAARGYRLPKNEEKEKKSPGETLLESFKLLAQGVLVTLMTLGIGWCVKGCLP